MEAIREIRRTRGHRVTINLPERFSGLEVEIIVLPLSRGKRRIKTDKLEALLLSESSLKKDWNADEEDQAWKNL